MTPRPRIGVTVGDPAGIGPEIARKAAADGELSASCEIVLYGPSTEAAGARFERGRVSAAAGRAAYDAIVEAVEDARAGRIDAVATAPINKEAFAAAGDVVEGTIALAASELPRFGFASPRLAVAGLNPHAGEHGVIGTEDRDVLAPAVAAARARGVSVDGPFAADTVFVRAMRGEFDAVVACYHDQGLIPIKLVAFGRAVNVTLGLPIVRTSVDHGTAFDIAGKGVADPSSLIEAIKLAMRLVREPRAGRQG